MNKLFFLTVITSIIVTAPFQQISPMRFQSEKTIVYDNTIYTKICKGNDKKVYKSIDKTKILLKFPNKENSTIINEIEVLEILDEHPNIIKIIKYDLDNSIIILESATSDLLQYLNTNKKLKTKDKLKILFEISKGIEYMHANDVIHNDIKLENIVITENSKCKLIDFSFSEKLIPEKEYSISKFLNGTLQYVSPNRFQEFSKNGVNKQYLKDDVYSFAILAYMLMHHKDIMEEFKLELKKNKIEIPKNKQKLDKYFINYLVKKNWRPKLYNDKKSNNGIINNLINRCWSTNPKNRPYIKEVKKELMDTLLLFNY